MKKLILTFIVVFSLFGCSKNPESYIPYIDGYWEIKQVEKQGNIVKSYNVSTTVDYFKVNEDLTGFRKKVAPSLQGTFTVTDNDSPFVLKIENNQLHIYYTVNNVTFKETIADASATQLIITNDEGFKYTYKPFEPITIDP